MTQSTNLSKNPSFDTRDTREPSYWKVNNAKKTKGTFENYEKNELQRKTLPLKQKWHDHRPAMPFEQKIMMILN